MRVGQQTKTAQRLMLDEKICLLGMGMKGEGGGVDKIL